MSTKTKYILQGLFFLLLSLFCLYLYFTGQTEHLKRFTLLGTVFAAFVGILFLKNGIKK